MWVLVIDGKVRDVSRTEKKLFLDLSKMKLTIGYYGALSAKDILSGDYMDYHEGSYIFIDRLWDRTTGKPISINLIDTGYLWNYIDYPEVYNAFMAYFGEDKVRRMLDNG